MSSGKVHATDSMIISALALGATVVGCPFEIAAPMSIGALSGTILTPDLDIENWNRAKRVLIMRVPVIGYAFSIYWYPYGKSIPHRHWTSHAPVVGTLGRVVYALLPLFVCFGVEAFTTSPLFWWLVVGLALSDIAHWVRDFGDDWVKSLFNR